MDATALMRRYYDAYNRGDAAELSALLAEDVVLRSAAGEQIGRDAYLATYRWMIERFEDRMTPEHIESDAAGATISIHDRLTARIDVPDFLGRSVRAGDVIELALTGRYTIAGDRIARIEISPRSPD
ncbi:MAG: nuclear transport factor 2 family protein [Sphingomonas sp.]|nr:nuclear transport factor 2 family protein [Sphingomonas sp.]MDX3885266.1 nuclear transport factor 2 family protein [Sphingomonas sp.]